MKINFLDTNTKLEKYNMQKKSQDVSKAYKNSCVSLDLSKNQGATSIFKNQASTIDDIMQTASNMNISTQRDYMTVMSNSMSSEDFSKLQEEGFDLSAIDPKASVTIIDHIKAQIVKSGKQVEGYTDNLTKEQMMEITSDFTLSNQISQGLKKYDAADTKSNRDSIAKEIETLTNVESLSDGAIKELVGQKLEPTIENIYMASFKNGENYTQITGGFDETWGGYLVKNGNSEDFSQIETQVIDRIKENGIELTKESLELGKGFVRDNIPFTKENFEYASELKKLEFPIHTIDIIEAASIAISEGKDAKDGILLGNRETIYEKANRIDQRMHLEEVRLEMTVEANIKLLQSGFSIDTAPMEELISALKEAKAQLHQELFETTDPILAEARNEIYQNSNEIIQEIKGFPDVFVGNIHQKFQKETISTIHEVGNTIKEKVQEIQQKYEPFITKPRTDLGDRIEKAFQSVDGLLEELDKDITSANQRALKIMAYNDIDLTEENFEKVLDADLTVQRIITKLNPGTVLSMIREGVNPLTLTFEELETYLNTKDENKNQKIERFSKFLYQLEKNNEITKEEKESFIGIYRMIHQAEKKEGALVGTLVANEQALSFSNMLQAYRYKTAKQHTYTVDDQFGTLEELLIKGKSISSQINESYIAREEIDTMMKHKMFDSITENTMRETLNYEQEIYSYIEQNGYALIPDTIAGVKQLFSKNKNMFDEISNIWSKNVLNKMEHKEAFVEDYKEFLEVFDELIENKIEEEKESTYLDIKELHVSYKQLGFMKQSMAEEQYFFPLEVSGETIAVNLKIEHSNTEKGSVRVYFNAKTYGEVVGKFEINTEKNEIYGAILSNSKEGYEKLKEICKDASNELEKNIEGDYKVSLFPNYNKDVNTTTLLEKNTSKINEIDTSTLYQIAKCFLETL
ncbi:MAG: DUF6240 domain-containing protein [Lachnospiraceae bacterium]